MTMTMTDAKHAAIEVIRTSGYNVVFAGEWQAEDDFIYSSQMIGIHGDSYICSAYTFTVYYNPDCSSLTVYQQKLDSQSVACEVFSIDF